MTIKSNSTATGASLVLPTAQDTTSQLHELHNLLRLCSFAAEARRTLREISLCEEVGIIPKDVQHKLSDSIHARGNWSELPDYLGPVLNDMAERIEALADREASKHLAQCKGGAA